MSNGKVEGTEEKRVNTKRKWIIAETMMVRMKCAQNDKPQTDANSKRQITYR